MGILICGLRGLYWGCPKVWSSMLNQTRHSRSLDVWNILQRTLPYLLKLGAEQPSQSPIKKSGRPDAAWPNNYMHQKVCVSLL